MQEHELPPGSPADPGGADRQGVPLGRRTDVPTGRLPALRQGHVHGGLPEGRLVRGEAGRWPWWPSPARAAGHVWRPAPGRCPSSTRRAASPCSATSVPGADGGRRPDRLRPPLPGRRPGAASEAREEGGRDVADQRGRRPSWCNVADVEPIVRHPEGGGTDWPLLHARSAGTEHVLFGYCVYGPGRGSQWHAHEEEDCFFIVSGTGTMYYEKDGEERAVASSARRCRVLRVPPQLRAEHRRRGPGHRLRHLAQGPLRELKVWAPFGREPAPKGAAGGYRSVVYGPSRGRSSGEDPPMPRRSRVGTFHLGPHPHRPGGRLSAGQPDPRLLVPLGDAWPVILILIGIARRRRCR